MVVFVRLSQNEEDAFRRLPFIMKFITYPGAKELAAPIPDGQIEQLKLLLERADTPVTFRDHICIGDIVKITQGALIGMTGFCCGVNNSEIAIHVEMLGYATTYIKHNAVEKVM